MRILVVSGFWPTRSNPITGIFVVQQVQAYVDAGCDVTVVAPQIVRGSGRGRPYHLTLDAKNVYSPCHVDVPQALSGGRAAVAFNSAACARAVLATLGRHGVASMFDGIHIHEVRYCGLSYVKWGQRVAGPAILTLHGVDPFNEARTSQPWFSAALGPMWQKLANVTLVGRPLLGYAERLGVPRAKCSIVHNGSALPSLWSSDQRPMGARRVIASVSNLVELKGIDLNLQALAIIRRELPALDWEYRVVGDGPERGRLEKLASDLGIADRVMFSGRLAHDETLAEIAACDVFSMPSWGENFGIVYLEAMGRGRPVIGCRGWGAAEMVRDGVDGLLVEPKDETSLRHALERLLTDVKGSTSMGAAARNRALEFSWGQNVRRHLDLFEAARS